MTLCDYCYQEMPTGEGGIDAPIVINGRYYRPIVQGTERFGWPGLPRRCHDCWVSAGDVRHCGCDLDEWSGYGEQSISSGRYWGEEDEDEFDDLDLLAARADLLQLLLESRRRDPYHRLLRVFRLVGRKILR